MSILLPWKEILLIFLLLFMTLSMNTVSLRNDYVNFIVRHHWVRSVIIFIMSYLVFSFNVENEYTEFTKITVSLFITFIFYFFITRNTVERPLSTASAVSQNKLKEYEDIPY